jgi:hypothetical protein
MLSAEFAAGDQKKKKRSSLCDEWLMPDCGKVDLGDSTLLRVNEFYEGILALCFLANSSIPKYILLLSYPRPDEPR